MTAKPLSLRPLAAGPFHARRHTDLSSPTLIGGLLVIAAIGVIAGLALFGKLMSDDLARQDRAQITNAAKISAARIDTLLLGAELEMSAVLRSLKPTDTPLRTETLRTIRQDTAQMLARGPLAGIAVVDASGSVVLEVAQSGAEAGVVEFAQPLESNTNLLSSRLRMVASERAGVPVLHLTSADGQAMRAVGAFDRQVILDALGPDDDASNIVTTSYLLDQEGRVIAATGELARTDRLEGPDAPYNAAPLEEVAFTTVTDAAGSQRLFATALLGGEQLRVVHIGAVQGGGAVFGRAGLLTLALVGPCLIGLILLISVIQNEWRKNDRRVNSASDAVARAEVAGDLLQAGIVDWNIFDSSVVYTRGWHDLFGYSDGVSGELVFDWIARIHADDRPEARRRYQRLMDGEIPAVDHTIRVLCADGAYTHIRERAGVRSDESGSVVRIILVQTPFVLKRAQEAAA